MSSLTFRFRKNPKPWKTLGSRKLIDLGEVKLHRDRVVSRSGFRTEHLRLSLDDFSIIVHSGGYTLCLEYLHSEPTSFSRED